MSIKQIIKKFFTKKIKFKVYCCHCRWIGCTTENDGVIDLNTSCRHPIMETRDRCFVTGVESVHNPPCAMYNIDGNCQLYERKLGTDD